MRFSCIFEFERSAAIIISTNSSNLTVGSQFNLSLLLHSLRKRIGGLEESRIMLSLFKILTASGVMGLLLWTVAGNLPRPESLTEEIFSLAILTITGIAGFLVMSVFLRIEELKTLKQVFRVKTRGQNSESWKV